MLFFEKGSPTKEIWYYEHLYPVGQKSYNKSRPVTIKEFDLEKTWWNNRVEGDNTWKVSIGDIRKRNYNLDISSPYFGEGDDNISSSDIIQRLKKSVEISDQLLGLLNKEIQ